MITTLSISKHRLTSEQRMDIKALILALSPSALLKGGQLIIHCAPGRNPNFVEIKEEIPSLLHNVLDNKAKLSEDFN